MCTTASKTSVVWFRKCLRLHDNRALVEAIRVSNFVIPLVVIDPFLVHPSRCGARPLQFFLDSLHDLDRSLRRLNSRLVVLTGDPVHVIPHYAQLWNVSTIFHESDTGRYGSVRDANVASALAATSIQLRSFHGHTLYSSDDVRAAYGADIPQSYQEFRNRVAQVEIEEPLPSPDALPPVPPSLQDFNASIPSLRDLGFDEEVKPTALLGGESHALARMSSILADEEAIRTYSKPKTSPLDFDPPSGTCFSPYLARGCLSVRLVRSKVIDILSRGSKQMKPPQSLLGQLLCREFYYACSYLTPNFYDMPGNPMCKQVEWRQDHAADVYFQAWAEGKTGFPWIDAVMNQLKTEGWIHNHARNAVACFLTKGDLWVDWRRGRDLFEKYLIDSDSALNNGGWLWHSGSGYVPKNFIPPNPASYAKKFRKDDGAFIRRYLAPLDVQREAGCVVGVDYPERIVNHEVESKVLLERMAPFYPDRRQRPNDVASIRSMRSRFWWKPRTTSAHAAVGAVDRCLLI
ncbi:hypothetical protein AeMF1_006178 [Aphanomyces euteiches]|nr:hypothetical protein AeMF1_006178 [Aphanomyces euteiches]